MLVALRVVLFLAKWVLIASYSEVFDIDTVFDTLKRYLLDVKGWMRSSGSKSKKKRASGSW